ncbi:MAG: TPM domain-containing protein [Candidatus Ancillula trichonymphae]|nr:TPM domain-containing protein [Candidatus Ancillula trichonymphae]
MKISLVSGWLLRRKGAVGKLLFGTKFYALFCAFTVAASLLVLFPLCANSPALQKAYAVEPMKLQDPITDPQNVLSDKKTQLYDSLKEVKSKTNQNLWVIFVPSFDGVNADVNKDGAIDANDWVDSVAKTSNLGADDIILAVATTKHEMVVYVSGESRYLKQKNLDIITNATMAPLQQGEWGNAALKFSDSVQKQILFSDNKIGYFIVIPLFLLLVGYLAFSMIKRARREKKLGNDKQVDEIFEYNQAPTAGLLSTAGTGYMQATLQNAQFPQSASAQYLQSVQYAQYGAQNNNLQNAWSSSYSTSTPTAQYTGLQAHSTTSTPTTVVSSAACGNLAPTKQGQQQNQQNYSASFDEILQRIEAIGKNYTTPENATSDILDTAKQSTSKSRPDALYDRYGISKDNAVIGTPTASAAPRTASTKEIYGDYYTRSASRFLYGSYYSDGQAAKHDESINNPNAHLDNIQTIYQPIGVDVSTNTNYTRSSQELYNKYYSNEPRSFLDRFKK